jgi:hypothetical protein
VYIYSDISSKLQDNFKPTYCYTPEAMFKKMKARIDKSIQKIIDYYGEEFTPELLYRARKDRVTYLQDKSLRIYRPDIILQWSQST